MCSLNKKGVFDLKFLILLVFLVSSVSVQAGNAYRENSHIYGKSPIKLYYYNVPLSESERIIERSYFKYIRESKIPMDISNIPAPALPAKNPKVYEGMRELMDILDIPSVIKKRNLGVSSSGKAKRIVEASIKKVLKVMKYAHTRDDFRFQEQGNTVHPKITYYLANILVRRLFYFNKEDLGERVYGKRWRRTENIRNFDRMSKNRKRKLLVYQIPDSWDIRKNYLNVVGNLLSTSLSDLLRHKFNPRLEMDDFEISLRLGKEGQKEKEEGKPMSRFNMHINISNYIEITLNWRKFENRWFVYDIFIDRDISFYRGYMNYVRSQTALTNRRIHHEEILSNLRKGVIRRLQIFPYGKPGKDDPIIIEGDLDLSSRQKEVILW